MKRQVGFPALLCFAVLTLGGHVAIAAEASDLTLANAETAA